MFQQSNRRALNQFAYHVGKNGAYLFLFVFIRYQKSDRRRGIQKKQIDERKINLEEFRNNFDLRDTDRIKSLGSGAKMRKTHIIQ